MDKTNHVPPKWPHLHVSSSKEKILQSLLSAVFPCMVEANASRDDQNGGEDDVVQDTESLRLPSHNTDVLHCHGGGTARLLAGWWWKIMTSRRRTLSGQYYHELFNQYNHSHWKALCKKKDTFHNSLSCLRFINIIEWMLWTSYWLTRNKASDQTSLSLVTAAGFATSVTIELWLLRSFLHRIYCRLNSSNITERKANDLFFHSNNDSEYHRLWEDNTVSTAINYKWLPSILRTQYSFNSNQRHRIPSTWRRQYSFALIRVPLKQRRQTASLRKPCYTDPAAPAPASGHTDWIRTSGQICRGCATVWTVSAAGTQWIKCRPNNGDVIV